MILSIIVTDYHAKLSDFKTVWSLASFRVHGNHKKTSAAALEEEYVDNPVLAGVSPIQYWIPSEWGWMARQRLHHWPQRQNQVVDTVHIVTTRKQRMKLEKNFTPSEFLPPARPPPEGSTASQHSGASNLEHEHRIFPIETITQCHSHPFRQCRAENSRVSGFGYYYQTASREGKASIISSHCLIITKGRSSVATSSVGSPLLYSVWRSQLGRGHGNWVLGKVFQEEQSESGRSTFRSHRAAFLLFVLCQSNKTPSHIWMEGTQTQFLYWSDSKEPMVTFESILHTFPFLAFPSQGLMDLKISHLAGIYCLLTWWCTAKPSPFVSTY